MVIGDVHGCHAELTELLGLLAPTADDELVFLGDLVNRGPDRHLVVEIARGLRARALLGNHELRLLDHRRTGDDAPLKDDDRRTLKQLTAPDWQFLESMALHHHLPDWDTVLVHGGFLPGLAWQTQPASVVAHIQVIDKDGRPRRRSDAPTAPFWADLWSGSPFVIYGHTPRPEVYARSDSLGIDTGCVMGGHLTAVVLPERRLVQVKAREKYF